jgi:hypothetical protein
MAFHLWELRPASEVGTSRRTRRLLARARFLAQAEHGRCCFGVLALGSKQHPTWVRQHAYPSVCAPQTLRPPEGFFCPNLPPARGYIEGVTFRMWRAGQRFAAPPHTQDVPLPGVLLAPSLAANAGSLSGILPFATLAHPWAAPLRHPPLRSTSCVWVVAPESPVTPTPKASLRNGLRCTPSPPPFSRRERSPVGWPGACLRVRRDAHALTRGRQGTQPDQPTRSSW